MNAHILSWNFYCFNAWRLCYKSSNVCAFLFIPVKIIALKMRNYGNRKIYISLECGFVQPFTPPEIVTLMDIDNHKVINFIPS